MANSVTYSPVSTHRFVSEWAARTALARAATHDLVESGFGPHDLSDVSEWLVDLDLYCRRCGGVAKARFSLLTFPEFSRQLHSEAVKCECGGSLDDRVHLVLEA